METADTYYCDDCGRETPFVDTDFITLNDGTRYGRICPQCYENVFVNAPPPQPAPPDYVVCDACKKDVQYAYTDPVRFDNGEDGRVCWPCYEKLFGDDHGAHYNHERDVDWL